MRLKVFDFIDEALEELKNNKSLYQEVECCLQDIFHEILITNQKKAIDIRSRVKSCESLREKIIRNRLYFQFQNGIQLLDSLNDIVGVTIECRFIKEEEQILEYLRKIMKETNSPYYNYSKYPSLYLNLDMKQPQTQKNGFSIYRMDGYYILNGKKINFELQIKSLVHSFWSEVEHKLVYKNTSFYVYDEFMRNLLKSVHAQLTTTDQQLAIIYQQMQDLANNQSLHEKEFEMQCSKAINDVFAEKMYESLGFTLNIKQTSTILGHYIFMKDIKHQSEGYDRISMLIQTFKKISAAQIDFEHEIQISFSIDNEDVFISTLGNHLLKVMNEDYDWFVFFKMLFAIEPGNDMEDFCLFLNVIKNYLIDDYWFKTSFIKLSETEQKLLQDTCIAFLVKSLVSIGKIQILHHNIMIAIRNAFIKFIEELETRVLSYKDFMVYETAYYESWLETINSII